jgi:hypothetical protein
MKLLVILLRIGLNKADNMLRVNYLYVLFIISLNKDKECE